MKLRTLLINWNPPLMIFTLMPMLVAERFSFFIHFFNDFLTILINLSLLFSNSVLSCTWEAEAEMAAYLKKERFILADCQLTVDEQACVPFLFFLINSNFLQNARTSYLAYYPLHLWQSYPWTHKSNEIFGSDANRKWTRNWCDHRHRADEERLQQRRG